MKAKWQFLVFLAVLSAVVLGLSQFVVCQKSPIVSVTPSYVSAREGDALAFNVTISDVENLYGIDLTIGWNNSMLIAQNVTPHLGVESQAGGVLHETVDYPIIIVESALSQETGQYRLVATSQGAAASFNGTGIIASIVFNVTKAGKSEISVQSELADHPQPGETISELIIHEDVGSSLDVSPIPEFPQMAVLAILAVGVAVTVIWSKKWKKTN